MFQPLHLQFPLISGQQLLELPPVSRQYPLMILSRQWSQKQSEISGDKVWLPVSTPTCLILQNLALVRGKSTYIFITLLSVFYSFLCWALKCSSWFFSYSSSTYKHAMKPKTIHQTNHPWTHDLPILSDLLKPSSHSTGAKSLSC